MPTRAQRRRNQEAREAADGLDAYHAKSPEMAGVKLGMRRDFVVEALRSRGIVSLTIRPCSQANTVDVLGGRITIDGTSKLRGDTVVNFWILPDIMGFTFRYYGDSALVSRLDHSVTAIDVPNPWLRTSDELLDPMLSVAEQGSEERVIVTREGFRVLTDSIGHQAISTGLQYVEGQIFGQ